MRIHTQVDVNTHVCVDACAHTHTHHYCCWSRQKNVVTFSLIELEMDYRRNLALSLMHCWE